MDTKFVTFDVTDFGSRITLGQWLERCELPKMPVHPGNTVSGGGDSSEAASSHPMACGNRCEKSSALAILFDRPVSIDSSSRAVPMSGSQSSTCGFGTLSGTR